MKHWRDFPDIWAVDYEFGGGIGEIPIPYCYVAKNLMTGELHRVWLEATETKPKYPVDNKNLFMAYYASAEMGCHIVLNYLIPPYILDLFTEFRFLTNGSIIPSGNSLIGACQYYGIFGSDFGYKETMRDRILKGGFFSEKEKRDILDYCQKDVEMLEKLFHKMKDKIELQYALLRGRYMGALAQVENYGIPIDTEKLAELRACWDIIKEELIWRVDQQYHVYEGTVFKAKKFETYLLEHGMPWEYTRSGLPRTDEVYMKEQAKAYPILKPLQELRYSISQLKLNDLQVGKDGRNRCILSALRSITGRNQPSSSKFIFGNSVWIRSLIKPTEGMAISYIDFEQQELIIAGVLSGDERMIGAYNSGDFYLSFAKSTGVIPPEGTKQTHPNEREQHKTATLAINYGMKEEGLAKRLGITLVEARSIIKSFKRTYNKYWEWNQDFCDKGKLYGEVRTKYGWRFSTKNLKKPNTLKNWPMQSCGADILKVAICLCIEQGIRVIAPVHDAILIEAPINEIDEKVKVTQKLMEDASEHVIGFRIRTEAKTFRYPEWYSDPRGSEMWGHVWNILESIIPSEKQARVYEKQNKNLVLDFEEEKPKKAKENISKRRKAQLMLKPQNFTEKQLAKKLREKYHFSHIEIMHLIAEAREIDFDLEHEIDWENTTYSKAVYKIRGKKNLKEISGGF